MRFGNVDGDRWETEYLSRLTVLRADQWHDMMISVSDQSVLIQLNGTTTQRQDYLLSPKTPFISYNSPMRIGSNTTLGLQLDDFRFSTRYLADSRDMKNDDSKVLMHFDFSEGHGVVATDRINGIKAKWRHSTGIPPFWKLLDFDEETKLIVKRKGVRNLIRLNSTVSTFGASNTYGSGTDMENMGELYPKPSPWVEHRFYVDLAPTKFMNFFESPTCSWEAPAAEEVLKKIHSRELLSPGVRCLVASVDEDKVEFEAQQEEKKLDDIVNLTPAEVIDIQEKARDIRIAPQFEQILRYYVTDSTLQRQSPNKAVVNITIPGEDLGVQSPYYEWDRVPVEGYRYCEPLNEAVPLPHGWANVHECKKACDAYSLKNPNRKYKDNTYSDRHASVASLNYNAPSCYAVTYFPANPRSDTGHKFPTEEMTPTDFTRFRDNTSTQNFSN
jgi:hypothetical protein